MAGRSPPRSVCCNMSHSNNAGLCSTEQAHSTDMAETMLQMYARSLLHRRRRAEEAEVAVRLRQVPLQHKLHPFTQLSVQPEGWGRHKTSYGFRTVCLADCSHYAKNKSSNPDFNSLSSCCRPKAHLNMIRLQTLRVSTHNPLTISKVPDYH